MVQHKKRQCSMHLDDSIRTDENAHKACVSDSFLAFINNRMLTWYDTLLDIQRKLKSSNNISLWTESAWTWEKVCKM